MIKVKRMIIKKVEKKWPDLSGEERKSLMEACKYLLEKELNNDCDKLLRRVITVNPFGQSSDVRILQYLLSSEGSDLLKFCRYLSCGIL